MTLVPVRPVAPVRTADAATLLAIFVALELVLPAPLVVNYLPMSLSPATLTAMGLGVFWVCTQMTTTLGAAKGPSPLRTMLFLWAGVLMASYAAASFGYLPADERSNSDHAMVVLLALVAVALVAVDGVRSRARLDLVVRALVVCGSLVAAVGVLQFAGLDVTQWLRPPGTHLEADYPAVIERAGLRRVAATTAHPIEFGVLCAMLLPLAIHLGHRHTHDPRRPSWWWACVGLLGLGVMFSISRSAILALAVVALVLMVGWSARRRVLALAVGAAFLVVVQLLSPGLIRTLLDFFRNAGSDDSVRYRTHDYDTAQQLILDNPLLGRGPGTWYAPKHTIFDNQYLLTLVETGVLGLLVFVGLLAVAIGSAFTVMRRSPADRDLALALTATLAAVVPTCATFDFAAFQTVTALAFVLLGLAGAQLRIVRAGGASAQLGQRRDPARGSQQRHE